MDQKTTRYQQVASRIRHLIENGVLKEGDRIPSLRRLRDELNVSINTVKAAYWHLENQGVIRAVPQSGFYVRKPPLLTSSHAPMDPSQMDPHQISLCHIFGAYQDAGQCTPEVTLAVAHLDSAFWPREKLGRYFHDAARADGDEAFTYLISPGHRGLREQIVKQGLSCGLDISPDDVIVTNGCQEAIYLAMMSLCEPGDTVVLESPIYFNLINMLRHLRLKVIEIPTRDDEGLNLDTLAFVLENQPVKAVFTIPNFNNPMGCTLPSWKKKKLVGMLARYGVPLIEDDIYGDLYFDKRPEPCKVYDTRGDVILCSSFSKTIAPGLRVGWLVPGRHLDRISQLKTLVNISSSPINQIVVARFLKEGGYKQHLRKVRRQLQENINALRAAILQYFPPGTRVTRPNGGMFVWVELPKTINTNILYRKAARSGILFAPGELFSIKPRYSNYLRLNAGIWSERLEDAIAHLGHLCHKVREGRAVDNAADDLDARMSVTV